MFSLLRLCQTEKMKKQMQMSPWEQAPSNTCQYCGATLSEKKIDYCSEECEKQDSVWHRV